MPLNPGHLGNQRTQTWPIAAGMRRRNVRAQQLPAAHTGRLVQEEMRHVNLHRVESKLDSLFGEVPFAPAREVLSKHLDSH